MTNRLKQEMKSIEIPPELHKRSKMGILKAKSEMRKRRAPKLLPYIATVACLAIITSIGFSLNSNSYQKHSGDHIKTNEYNHPKIIKFTFPKMGNSKQNQTQVQEQQKNQWLDEIEKITITKSEYSNFKYFLNDLNKDKNLSNSNYANNDCGTIYAYSKYFEGQETDPVIKADEQSLMDQVKKVVLSNKDPKEVQTLKNLINRLDQKYQNYSANGSYQGLIGDYKKIADLARNYQLPKSGIVTRSEKPTWYELDPNEVVYKNGYMFNKKSGQNTGIVVPKGQTVQSKKPTKEQYLGVVEGKINGLIDQVQDPSNVAGFETNRKDIQVKLKEINEAKKYAADYPLIQSKLAQIELTLKQAETNGHSEQTLKKVINLYHDAVLNGQELYHAIQVGQELRNTTK